MILDPRKRFKETPYAKTWADAVASDWFQSGLLASLATINMETGNCPDMATATAVAMRAEGARKLVDTMMTLTDEPKVPTNEPISRNLKQAK